MTDPAETEPALPSAAFLDRNAVRVQARQHGVTLTHVEDEKIDRLLTACNGDVEFAVIATTIVPRPLWVSLRIGPPVSTNIVA